MKKPSHHDEMTIRHRFDRLCQMSLKGEAINYYRHMDYRREHEAVQINRLLAEPSCDAQVVKQLAFQRAAEQYRNIRIDERAYQNEKTADALSGVGIQTACDLILLEKTIGKIVVQKHTGLEFYLKNGRSITIPIKET